MKSATLLILCLYGLVEVIALPTSLGPIDCSRAEQLLEELEGAQFMEGPRSDQFPLPTTEDAMVQRCKDANSAIKVLKRLNKECYSGLPQQVLGAVLRTRGQLIEQMCKQDSPDFNKTLAMSQCMGLPTNRDEYRDADDLSIKLSQVLSDTSYPESKDRLKATCCSVGQSRGYAEKVMHARCPEHEKLHSQHVDSYLSEAFGLICSDIAKFQCDQTAPIVVEGVTLRTRSNMVPVLRNMKLIDHV